MEPARKRSKVSAAETTGVALPLDVMEEILMRVPARSLCRLRAVCRSWRSLVSDPSFVKAHAVLHPALILTLGGAGDHIDVVDLSGNVVKRINVPAAEEEGVLPAHPGPFYLFRAPNSNRVRVVDPDTGAVSALPVDNLDPPPGQWTGYWPQPCYTLWRDFSTGHRKVLRIATLSGNGRERLEQPCHVLTLGGNDQNQRRWRPTPSPPACITTKTGVAGVIVQGFAHFLPDSIFPNFDVDDRPREARPMHLIKAVASFDLEAEEWRPAVIPGPSAIDTGTENCRLKLVKLRNMLAMMHYHCKNPVVDMWFAADLEKGLWFKKHSVPRELLVPYNNLCLYEDTKLLMELDDGRIVFSYHVTWIWAEGAHWLTQIYDPRTQACIHVPQRGVRGMHYWCA